MKIFLLFTILSLIIATSVHTQSIDDSWKLYDDTQVARIDITINPSSISYMYSNVNSDSLHVASMHFKNKWIDEDIDSIGIRLRGNTSRDSRKKSFKISFNNYKKGRKFYGVDKLDINGEHNDPSIIRSKLCSDLFKDIGIAASRASFAELYFNNKYYGLYISLEDVDDKFLSKNFIDDSGNLWKCLYPADLSYLGLDPNLYKFYSGNRRAYELATNEEMDDYSKLARLINILNRTVDNSLPDSLEKILDVAGVLKYFAWDILVGQWDDYWSNQNNYYLYHNPSEDKFHIIPYDYDNTFGIDWFNINWSVADLYNFPKITSGARPLAERLIANAQYRNLYTHFLEFYNENVFDLPLWDSRINSYKNMITPYAEADTFRTKDWGFTINDFNFSYTAGPYSNQHVKNGLRQYINLRYNSLLNQLNYVTADPIVYSIDWSPKNPAPYDSVYVTIAAFSHAGIYDVEIQFTPEGSSSSQNYPMTFQPIPQTKIIEETDRWVGVIPPLGAGSSGSFKILIKDVNQRSLLYPRANSIIIKTPAAVIDNLVINEFMAANTSTIADSAGEFDDWIELYNPTNNAINLNGLYLSDRPDNLTKWQFTGDNLTIGAGEYLLIWCDEDQQQGSLHTNFQLSANGEFIGLTSADGVTAIDSISFGLQTANTSYGRFPDASESWQFFNTPTPGSSNIITGIQNNEQLPVEFELTAYPNPFNPITTIRYSIPNSAKSYIVTLKIYDVLGNEITNIINKEQSPGIYEVKFDAGNLASGMYLIRIQMDKFSATKKLMLLK